MAELETVKKFVLDTFDIDLDEVTPGNNIAKIGVSSLDLAQIASAVEEKFDIVITDDELYSVRTINDLLKLLTITPKA